MADRLTRSDSLRVLVVVTSSQRRGAEIEGLDLTSALRDSGVAAEVVALAPGSGDRDLEISPLGARPLGLRTLRALRRRALETDVVIAYGSSTLTACAVALLGTNVPFVYRSIGDPARWVRGRVHRARWAILYRRAIAVVALWPGGARSIAGLFGVAPERITVIPNARHADAFDPVTACSRRRARIRLGVADSASVVAIVGALSEEKQVHLAIEAIGTMPGVSALVAGDGPMRQGLEALAERVAPDRVRFLGRVDDVETVFHAADALVLTSRTEGMPGVVIEAGLCGIPSVATSVGALPELIDHRRTGGLILEPSADVVSAAIGAVLPNASSAGAAARRRMLDSFSWLVVVPRWIEFLEALPGVAQPRR